MKKLIIIALSLVLFNSCINDDLEAFSGSEIENFTILEGNLTTRTLTRDKKYLIRGQVFVREGQILTIEAGTVLFGDKASKGTLIISLGGRIIADGTVTQPIVFTSAQKVEARDRGDWGGIVILGRANVNQTNPVIEGISPPVVYGGTIDNDNSGILKFVRIEYAGIELSPNNETNSLTMGGVGNATLVENVQVSYGGDDGFEWFGGSVNGKNLIAYGMWDDCFDIDFGWTGKLQFLLSVRYPSFADQSGSNIIETDSGPSDNPVPFLTNGVISNLTAIGPRLTSSTPINTGNYQHYIDMRRRTALTIANSVFVGMPRGIRMNTQTAYDNYFNNQGALINNIMSAPLLPFANASGMTATAANVQSLWNATNTTLSGTDLAVEYASLGINPNTFYGANTQNFYTPNPNFEVTTGTLTIGASFANAKLNNTYFSVTMYRGAFGANDWTNGWAEFVPNLRAY